VINSEDHASQGRVEMQGPLFLNNVIRISKW
jgi:hypothetical protein